ncbi:hypothetical protein B566_EDAN012020 [Ephemera danica]|nr:hypothetical protein B566_EDAN012020 [Ephemera danica]
MMNMPPTMQGPMSGPMPTGMQPQIQQPPGNMQQQQQQPQQEKLDNISKVKSLVGPLRDSLSITLKTAAHALHHNSLVDLGTMKGNEIPVQRFDKNLEEFYSICDQMELHLKTAIECVTQGNSSQRYLPMQVALTRMESGPVTQQQESLSYPQFLATVRSQVSYSRELHDTLIAAAQALGSNE